MTGSEVPRPPSILSPHGEGYCRHCRFVVGLGADGLMDTHQYNRGLATGDMKPCKGSGKVPPRITPYAAELNKFKATARKVVCPTCEQTVTVGWMNQVSRHEVKGWTREMCKGSFQIWKW